MVKKQKKFNKVYETINGFELRSGKAYNCYPSTTPEKFEIRILTQDFDLGEALLSKIKEWLK